MTQGLRVLTDLQMSCDQRGVAATAVDASVGNGLGLLPSGTGVNPFAAEDVTSFVAGIATELPLQFQDGI